ncbi:peroxiredoxin family protein [Sulfuricurvum sp.]|uniref:peroxiredoxin family protein n=1 Tax=Sulfuricurvum sp. TaxID=2025608 RepID=UPI002D61E270|nr:peroxiredoxin family protein [Sulfuricurvum sp.]HZF69678.1 peroxiredoxin family protein [Sulfuricurvum sp.]
MRYILIGLIVIGQLLGADGSLKSELDAYNALFYKQGSAEAVGAVEDDLSKRHTLNMRQHIPKVGDKAIEFSLKNINGERFDLNEAFKHSPVVLFWYRGGWCPYCNIQLSYYQRYHQAIKNAGGRLVGIAPEVQSMGRVTQQDHEIDFDLLSDTDNAVAKQYHLVYTVQPKLLSLMDERFGLDDYYPVHKQELPLTVAFVIDQSGIIRYAYIDDDFRKRAEPTEIIDVLNKLKEQR